MSSQTSIFSRPHIIH